MRSQIIDVSSVQLCYGKQHQAQSQMWTTKNEAQRSGKSDADEKFLLFFVFVSIERDKCIMNRTLQIICEMLFVYIASEGNN